MNRLQRYRAKLSSIPPPGSGCHTSLLSVANLGVRAGLSAEMMFLDIQKHIPYGQRQIPDSEIWEAVDKALADHGHGHSRTFVPKQQPPTKDLKAERQWIISHATITDEADLWERSPIRISWLPQKDVPHAL